MLRSAWWPIFKMQQDQDVARCSRCCNIFMLQLGIRHKRSEMLAIFHSRHSRCVEALSSHACHVCVCVWHVLHFDGKSSSLDTHCALTDHYSARAVSQIIRAQGKSATQASSRNILPCHFSSCHPSVLTKLSAICDACVNSPLQLNEPEII